jgi:hypothetical protein
MDWQNHRGAMQAQIYIVRIYRRNGAPGIAGVVEIVQRRRSESFRNFEELRAILDKPPRDSRLKVKGSRRNEP